MMRQLTSPAERRRFFAFVVTGIVNTAFGYGAFALFLWSGLGRDLAVLFGMIVGIAFNYGTIGKVFAAQGFSRLPHFLASYAMLFGINITALRMLESLGVGHLVAEAVILGCLVPVTFLAMRLFVFPAEHGAAQPENLFKGSV
jgi:putative flippase GtrA